ncbi:MAG: ABC transporter ATP-binding protein [Eubacteriales bacterium]
MIEIKDADKYYGDFKALDSISLTIRDGSIFGFIGSNGSGKSTLLRIIAGIFRPERGYAKTDGENIYENTEKKKRIIYISDDQYVIPSSTAEDVKDFYSHMYDTFDAARFDELISDFSLDKKRQISGFSKGMKKQLDIICAVSSKPDYILCDETFDGLDPVARAKVKRLLAEESAERNMTSVIASHNLREIEDICDGIALMHKGKIVIENSIDDIKTETVKIQAVFKEEKTAEDFKELNVSSFSKSGSLYTIFARCDSFLADKITSSMSPVFYEVLPLTLEEIFITEMEDNGYGFGE